MIKSTMAAPLLKTKLYIPHVRPGLVPRPRLLERLDEGTQSEGFAQQSLRFVRKLTLISAPAGFGKTTLLATRADPPWPLARLRVRGRMIELRTEDLRFTSDEVSAFLNKVMGLALSTQDIATLDTRTEDCIAGWLPCPRMSSVLAPACAFAMAGPGCFILLKRQSNGQKQQNERWRLRRQRLMTMPHPTRPGSIC
jgi:ATP/maltotriose-dependent transcriptional regulator MalT